jgi:hypothetical protein
MSDDVFSQTGNEGDGQTNAISELVGEGKKFSTLEDLAKGKQQADQFIEQLQNENKLAREKLAELESSTVKEQTIADLIQTVKATNEQATEEGDKPISEDRLSKMVRDIMEGESEAQTRATNRARANKAVLEKVNGDVEAAKSYLAETAKQLGTSVDTLTSLSESSPTAFLKLIESGAPNTGSQSTQSIGAAANTGSLEGTAKADVIDGAHTKHYYDRLKADLGPAKYWNDTKIQSQYLKDATKLGDRFNQ